MQNYLHHLKRLLYCTLSLLLVSCSVCSRNPGLHDLSNQLLGSFNIHPNNVCDINYGYINEDTLGVAEIYIHKCDITVEPKLPTATQRYVLLHEILHCAGLDHIDTIEPQIMNTRAPADWVIEKDWSRMVIFAKDQLRRHRGR